MARRESSSGSTDRRCGTATSANRISTSGRKRSGNHVKRRQIQGLQAEATGTAITSSSKKTQLPVQGHARSPQLGHDRCVIGGLPRPVQPDHGDAAPAAPVAPREPVEPEVRAPLGLRQRRAHQRTQAREQPARLVQPVEAEPERGPRSEERRVGKECRL